MQCLSCEMLLLPLLLRVMQCEENKSDTKHIIIQKAAENLFTVKEIIVNRYLINVQGTFRELLLVFFTN